MIIIAQTLGTGLTELAVVESVYVTRTGLPFETFDYDGADWVRTTAGDSTVVDLLNEYGITYTGTPVANDQISVAQQPSQLWEFFAGNGVNCDKLNENFAELQQLVNNNENSIDNIVNTALLRDGSNLTQSAIDAFQRQTPTVLNTNGNISLADNKVYFITLTANNNNKIILPAISPDNYSHTIVAIVQSNSNSLDIQTATSGHHLYNHLTIDLNQPYSIMFIYNKIDGIWYYSLTQ